MPNSVYKHLAEYASNHNNKTCMLTNSLIQNNQRNYSSIKNKMKGTEKKDKIWPSVTQIELREGSQFLTKGLVCPSILKDQSLVIQLCS